MTVDKSSRYARTPIVTVTTPDGESAEMIGLRRCDATTGVFYVVPNDADRLDLLAHRYYRDPLRFWQICDASPEMDPLDVVTSGEPLLIPPNR